MWKGRLPAQEGLSVRDWVVADGDVNFVVSELSRGVFEFEVMHVHWLIKYRFKDWGVSEDWAGEKEW